MLLPLLLMGPLIPLPIRPPPPDGVNILYFVNTQIWSFLLQTHLNYQRKLLKILLKVLTVSSTELLALMLKCIYTYLHTMC